LRASRPVQGLRPILHLPSGAQRRWGPLNSNVRRHDSCASALLPSSCQRLRCIACNAIPASRSCYAGGRQTSPDGSTRSVCLAGYDSIRSAELAKHLSVLYAAGAPYLSAPALVSFQRGLLRRDTRRGSARHQNVASWLAQRQVRQHLSANAPTSALASGYSPPISNLAHAVAA
jgi:hypothetical protein